MILLDTSMVIAALSGKRTTLPALQHAFLQGERVLVCTLVLYEWMRGPRTVQEIGDQERLFPSEQALPFGVQESVLAADIYRAVKRARSREMDIAIAATAIRHKARLWTLNPADFADIPGLSLYSGFSGHL